MDETIKLRIKEATDLVALVESYLPLRKAGRAFSALCPFHQEKTASFTVYPDSQHFKCYGCGKAGDVFTFVMEREGLAFRDAAELLGQRAGVSTEGLFAGGARRAHNGVDPHAVLASVRDFFQQVLQSQAGTVARQYLESRGLEPATEAFKLGAHPSDPHALARFARDAKLPRQVLEQAGLLREGREPFRGRLMFPIEDARGRVVGFGGRALDDAKAKYINSPESPFFSKRQLLYGLPQVKRAGERQVVVVEGYTDVIGCHLAGFRGAVATLGTALTPDHGNLLVRYASDGVVLLFDGDRAGRAAAEKAYGELVKTDLPLRAALLDEGTDPADLLAARPGRDPGELERAVERFAEIVDGAVDALQMWFKLKRQRLDLRQEVNVVVAVAECQRVLEVIDDPTRARVLLSRMAQQLGLDEAAMRRSMKQRRSNAQREPELLPDEEQPRRAPSPLEQADAELLACVLACPSLAPLAAAEPPPAAPIGTLVAAAAGLMVPAGGAEIAAAAGDGSLQAAAGGIEAGLPQGPADGFPSKDTLIRMLFTRCAEDPESGKILAHCADLASRLKEPEEAFDLLCRQRRAYLAKRSALNLRFELQQARAEGDRDRVNDLTRRYVEELRIRSSGPP